MPKRGFDISTLPTIDRLREVFSYDPEAGILRWRKAVKGARAGAIAGNAAAINNRHLRVKLDRKRIFVHRVIWAMQTGAWPTMDIDHKNGNPEDNRWVNLRLCTPAQNIQNAKFRSNNTTGFKGIFWDKDKQVFVSKIMYERKSVYLGRFKTAQEAHAAYAEAAKKYHGDFVRIDP
jgi:hypothetical protein